MDNNERTALLICAYNEEANIHYVLEQAKGLQRLGLIREFIVVDDGSTDKTASIAKGSGATVISLPKNMGKGGAFLQGLLYCKKSGLETVLAADADLVAGFTQKQAIFLLEELCLDANGKKTLMAVYPQTEQHPYGGEKSKTTRCSGIRVVGTRTSAE